MLHRVSTTVLLTFFALLWFAGTARAESAPTTPEAVAQQAMTAMAENRLSDFSALMHPTALADFKKLMLTIVDAAEKDGKGTDILGLFSEVKSIEELRALSDQE